ncbi:MAG TPA: tRNA (adenosine(37)-N6)-threonylcarbamoyltransferase complex dimerization subunit type 1 TsaB [Streptosporangiaceae bacterium]
MLVLAFDTATPAVTVAVGGAGQVLAQRTVVDARRHGELLAVGIGEVLAEAGVTHGDLDAIVSGTGPGPYTGLRVGLVTARVLGSALGVNAYGFCTLDIIAADAVPGAAGREFLVATDARRRELYWARYSAAGVRLSGPEVAVPAALPAGLPVAGEGAHAYPELLGEPIAPRYPSAATAVTWCAARLAAGEPLGPPDPLYLRKPDARVPGSPRSVLAAPASSGRATVPATESQGPQASGGSRPSGSGVSPGGAVPPWDSTVAP